jgi:hypothetical protein
VIILTDYHLPDICPRLPDNAPVAALFNYLKCEGKVYPGVRKASKPDISLPTIPIPRLTGLVWSGLLRYVHTVTGPLLRTDDHLTMVTRCGRYEQVAQSRDFSSCLQKKKLFSCAAYSSTTNMEAYFSPKSPKYIAPHLRKQ